MFLILIFEKCWVSFIIKKERKLKINLYKVCNNKKIKQECKYSN
jgi:hypothetical protein